jgi:hypothetical protein
MPTAQEYQAAFGDPSLLSPASPSGGTKRISPLAQAAETAVEIMNLRELQDEDRLRRLRASALQENPNNPLAVAAALRQEGDWEGANTAETQASDMATARAAEQETLLSNARVLSQRIWGALRDVKDETEWRDVVGRLSELLPFAWIKEAGWADQYESRGGIISTAAAIRNSYAGEPPAIVKAVIAMGYEPSSPEGIEIIKGYYEGKLDSDLLENVQMELERLKVAQRTFDLAEDQRESAAIAEDADRLRRATTVTLGTDFADARKLAELNENLGKSALATGLSFRTFAREVASIGSSVDPTSWAGEIMGKFGFDSERATQLVADFDTFNKLSQQFVLAAAAMLSDAGFGNITNAQLRIIEGSVVSGENSTEANREIIARNMEAILNAAYISGVPILNAAGADGTQEWREIIEAIRQGPLTSLAPPLASAPGPLPAPLPAPAPVESEVGPSAVGPSAVGPYGLPLKNGDTNVNTTQPGANRTINWSDRISRLVSP